MYAKNIDISGTNNGYYYFLDKDHPLARGNSGLVYLHRHLASTSIGRWLVTEEHVHHINGDKLDNSPQNLQILSNKEHRELHRTLPKVLCICGVEFIPHNKSSKYCSIECSNTAKIKNPNITKDILDSLIPTTSWVKLGKMFGYTDNGIKKRAAALGCNIHKVP